MYELAHGGKMMFGQSIQHKLKMIFYILLSFAALC